MAAMRIPAFAVLVNCVCHKNCFNPATCGVWATTFDGYCSAFEQCQLVPQAARPFLTPYLCAYCPSSAPIWDPTVNQCRGCTTDNQCSAWKAPVVLTASDASVKPRVVDTGALTLFGIAPLPGTNLVYVTSPATATVRIYNGETGAIAAPPLDVPDPAPGVDSFPTGIIFSPVLNRFIVATANGQIFTLNHTTRQFTLVVNRYGLDAAYTGLDFDLSGNYLIVANYDKNARDMEIFDYRNNFVLVDIKTEPGVPADLAPRNVVTSGGRTWVAYGKFDPNNTLNEITGPGTGYVSNYDYATDKFTPFVSGGLLDAPFSIAAAENSGFLTFVTIANSGDGFVNTFAPDGTFLGQLQDTTGKRIRFPGVLDIVPVNPASPFEGYFVGTQPAAGTGIFGRMTYDLAGQCNKSTGQCTNY